MVHLCFDADITFVPELQLLFMAHTLLESPCYSARTHGFYCWHRTLPLCSNWQYCKTGLHMTGLTIDNKYTFLHCVFEMIDGKETGMLIVCSTCVLNTSELKYTGNKHTDHSGTGQRYVGLCIRLALISHTQLHTHIHTPP